MPFWYMTFKGDILISAILKLSNLSQSCLICIQFLSSYLEVEQQPFKITVSGIKKSVGVWSTIEQKS